MSGEDDSGPPRARHNPDLFGHADAEETVTKAWASGRFPHAWLICGPQGIGKATLAYRMARWVLAGGDGGQGAGLFGEPAGDGLYLSPESGTFRRIVSGGHPDFRALERPEGKTSIPVEDVRGILGFVHQTPAESDWKAIVIDSADELNTSGANAILKALEEPPPHTLFLLVSHAPGRLLPTIRSRCRKLTLSPLSPDDMRALIRQHAPDISDSDAGILIQLGEGSIGRALDYAAAGGIDLYRAVLVLLSNPARPDPKQLYGLADTLSPKHAEAAYLAFRNLFDWWIKRAIRSQATGIRPAIVVPEEERALEGWNALGGLETSMQLWEKLTGLLAQSDNPANLDKRQLIVAAFGELQKVATARR
ncbi:MAG: DNA polymerase III subunit delta' [Alphaproteobacteria bacterium]|nr:DNA polymerase III subunit delta' [Alphaproteobacteria bacterium]